MNEIDLRAIALAKTLGVSLEDIAEGYGDYSFVVNPHRTKRGPSPGEIQERADLLHRALQFLGMDVGTQKELVERGQAAYRLALRYMLYSIKECATLLSYEALERMERLLKSFAVGESPEAEAHRAFSWLVGQYKETREMRKAGLHDLANTLYHLTENIDDERNRDYILSLVEAFEGREVTDHREWVKTDDGEYLVVTDEEADRLWDEDLENYLNDCILPEVPELSQRYFDREAWKRDARMDGRAHSLNRYDGSEEFITLDTDDVMQFLRGDDWVEEMDEITFEDLSNEAFADFDEPVTFYIYRQN